VFQEFALLPWRTVAGNVALVLDDRLSRAECLARISEVLWLTGLTRRHAQARRHGACARGAAGVSADRRTAVSPRRADLRLLLDEFAALIERAGTATIYVTHTSPQIVVLSRRPGRVRHIERIDRPLAKRQARDPDLLAIEVELWRLIRDHAASAERDIEA
jgi:NitT/TauT family transport system ATP-binding protein